MCGTQRFSTAMANVKQSNNPRRTLMKQAIAFLIIGLSLLMFPACMTVHLTAEGYDKPASMSNNVNKKYTIVKHFSRNLKGWFAIFNLVTVSNPDVQRIIQNEVMSAQGDAVINVKLEGQTTFIDGAIPVALGVIGALVAPPGGVYASYLIGARTYTV
jgi:hypothetical protein